MTSDEYKLLQKDVARLKENVLSRVHTVNSIRSFIASPMSSAVLTVSFLSLATIFVSIVDVVRNTMVYGEWGSRFLYTYTSIMHTQVIVQILAVLVFLCGLMLIARLLFKLRAPASFLGHFIYSHIPFRFWRS